MRASSQAGGRWDWLPAIAAVTAWCALLAMATLPALRGAALAGSPWMLEPLFHDWHVVRQGWAANAAAVDPLATTDLPFNYPRFVLLGGVLGGMRIPPLVAGLGLAAALLGALVWVLKPRTGAEALLAAALVLSPPVLLLIERGNLDAAVFALLVVGLGLSARRSAGPVGLAAGSAAVFAAAALKLYPAAVLLAAAMFWRGSRQRWLIFFCVVFAGCTAMNLDEVAWIIRKTTRGLEPAYGRMIAGSRYYVGVLARHQPAEEAQRALRGMMQVSLIVCLAGFAVAAGVGWRLRHCCAAIIAEERERVLFWSGALIYAGTFLLGSNWSYRLVFLLLCVPLLWRARQIPAVRSWATVCLAGVAATMLAPFHLPLAGFFVQQAVAWSLAWLLFGGAVAILAGGAAPAESDVPAPARAD